MDEVHRQLTDLAVANILEECRKEVEDRCIEPRSQCCAFKAYHEVDRFSGELTNHRSDASAQFSWHISEVEVTEYQTQGLYSGCRRYSRLHRGIG